MEFLKISALIAGGILAIVFSWYSVSRIRAVNTPLSVYSFKENITEKNTSETGKLKVASYNIAHGRGGKYGAKNRSHKTEKELLEHLDKIAEQIKNERPDMIVLNETDFSSAWSFNINQTEYIGKKCGYPYILEQKNIVVSFPFYRLCFGNAILSRYPIQNEKFIDFQPYSELEDIFAGNHDAFSCELELPSGPVGIFGIHFEHRNEATRVRCAEILAEMCSEIKFPVIALGDFNSTPSGLPKSQASENGKNAMSFLFSEKEFVSYLEEKDAYTFPSEKPDRLIDWIIGKRIREFSNSKIIKSDLSDHLMVVTEVEFENQK
ncbi:endonuclease/exonuclease/phosphatase family protein [Desulfococcaceae bacterium HSG8]|nr:endonuclease/exonuclease/phosphatase family protein [Desulfococcaceae bacterium HSG8]